MKRALRRRGRAVCPSSWLRSRRFAPAARTPSPTAGYRSADLVWYFRDVRRVVGWSLALAALLGASKAPAWSWPGEAARLGARLHADEVEVRRAAAQRLPFLSPALARPLVAEALEDPDVEVRLAAARAAIAFDDDDVGRLVVEWLGAQDPRLRLAATEVLRQSPVDEAIEPLGRVLSDPDERARLGAARALGESGHPRAAVQLLGRLDDREARVRVAIADALGRLGDPRAVLPLVSKIQDGEPEVRIAVARALGLLGDARASSALVVSLQDRDEAVAIAAIAALGDLGDVSVTPSLLSVVEGSQSASVRASALLALARLGQPDGLRRVVQALGGRADRGAAKRALIEAGAPARGPTEDCLAQSTPLQVAAACAEILADIAPDSAAPVIGRALRQGRLAPLVALRALTRAPTRSALILALEHLAHPEADVRAAALSLTLVALREEGPDPRAAGPLLEAFGRPNWSLAERAELVEALGASGAPEAALTLASLVDASDERIRERALEGLGALGQPVHQAALLAALDDEEPSIRRAAAMALRRSADPTSVDELLNRLEKKAQQDRAAVALALTGPLQHVEDFRALERTEALISRVPDPIRDPLIEALGSALDGPQSEPAEAALGRLARSPLPADRAKVAEVLAVRGRAVDALRRLSQDVDASVRANAVYGLGRVGDASRDASLLVKSLSDRHGAVAGNAAAALGRLQVRTPDVGARLCATLDDHRPLLRANALFAVDALGVSCDPAQVRRLLVRDPSEQVRVMAAFVLAKSKRDEDIFALRRCEAHDASVRVARACSITRVTAEAKKKRAKRAANLVVFVAPAAGQSPIPGSFFVLQEEDHAIRAGNTDRRGALLTSPEPEPDLLEPGLLRMD